MKSGVLLAKLRSLVRDPTRGEWRTTRITMTAPGRITYDYDFGPTRRRTPPDTPFNPQEEHEALLDFTTWMVQTLPTEWDQLRVVEFFLELKRNMHKPGKDAWTSLRFHLIRDSSRYSAQYDWDNEPDWDHVPPVELFARELELFPRDEDRVPAWLRRRLDTTP